MIRLAVRCRPELAERVLADLLALAPDGVEEERGGGWVEYAIYGPPGEIPALPDLEAAAGDGLVEISSTEVPDDWADRWRDFHRPVPIAGGRIVVRPSWEPAATGRGAEESAAHPGAPGRGAEESAAHPGATGRGAEESAAHPGATGRGAEEAPGIDVVIDPGQAFGTGAHATTGMCLELLLELADEGEAGGPLADLGTGSGVLAIAAAKLGWDPVCGCDSEPAALEAAAQNARVNAVELELTRVNLREQEPPDAPALIANLTAPLLESVAARIRRPPRVMVCSGLLASEADPVRTALRAAGLEAFRELSRGDWTALLCRRGDSDQASK